jgi:hypothetical protein
MSLAYEASEIADGAVTRATRIHPYGVIAEPTASMPIWEPLGSTRAVERAMRSREE